MKMIRPTSRAPYLLSFVGDEFTPGVPGTAAVNYEYRLSTDTLHAIVKQYNGRGWGWVATVPTSFKSSAVHGSEDALEAYAIELIDEVLPS